MKPDWDKLMAEYAGHATALVADVDCTAAGKPLCDSNGVRGFPTIKYGDPSDLQAYEGGRDFDSLSKFAKENLKPICSPANIDLCDDEQKASIEKFQAMSSFDLGKLVAEKEKEIADAETHFKEEVGKLQAAYEKLTTDKAKTIEDVKNSGLGTMKSVINARIKAEKAEKKEEL